jgi:hypothetical protein
MKTTRETVQANVVMYRRNDEEWCRFVMIEGVDVVRYNNSALDAESVSRETALRRMEELRGWDVEQTSVTMPAWAA